MVGKYFLQDFKKKLMFHRIAVAPPFSGLCHFAQGHSFKQWTGDDSKALMKVGLQFKPLFMALSNKV